MGEQNQEVLLQALHQITRMHLEISKAGDSLWQVSLDFPNQVKENQPSSVSAADISNLLSEANSKNSQSNSINSVDVDSAGQSSASSESSSETESSDYSALDSPLQASNPDSGVSQSNPIDLPDTNLLEQSFNSRRCKSKQTKSFKRETKTEKTEKTEYEFYDSLIRLLNQRFGAEEIKDYCALFINIRCDDFSSYERITKMGNQEMIRESLMYLRKHDIIKEFIEHIKKKRNDIQDELLMP